MTDPVSLLRQAADKLTTPVLACGCGVAPEAAPDWSGGCSRGCMEPVPDPLEEACPGIAEPLAAWLRHEADDAERIRAESRGSGYAIMSRHAIDLARAILHTEGTNR